MADTESPIIDLRNITYRYPNQSAVLKNFSFSLRQNERIGIIAPNGTGKTTLLHLIMGGLKPNSGSIRLFDRILEKEADYAAARRQIGLLFQDSDDQLFSPTVLEDVAFGPLNQGKSKEEAIEISLETLRFLGLDGFENRVTLQLSGGEKRMVALATILAMRPKALLLDEPTAGLDDGTKHRLIEILNSLSLTALIMSHDYEFLDAVSEKIHTIRDGQLITDNEFFVHSHVHSHPYGGQKHNH